MNSTKIEFSHRVPSDGHYSNHAQLAVTRFKDNPEQWIGVCTWWWSAREHDGGAYTESLSAIGNSLPSVLDRIENLAMAGWAQDRRPDVCTLCSRVRDDFVKHGNSHTLATSTEK